MILKLGQPRSFTGIGRRANQEDMRMPDSDTPSPANIVFAVCDGVGGQDKGEVASAAVARYIADSTRDLELDTPVDMSVIENIVAGCYGALSDISDVSNSGMATTLALVIFNRAGCYTVHIGDSRIYQLRPGAGIVFRSKDHSLVADLVAAGLLKPDEARDHPRRNVITRCLRIPDPGDEPSQATTSLLSDIRADDIFMLCSDGVLESMDESDLVALLTDTSRSVAERVETLRKACADSSNDNNTAIVIPVESAEGASVEAPGHVIRTRETNFTLEHPGSRTTVLKKVSDMFRKIIRRQ